MSQTELAEQLDALARQYGNRFLLEPAPDDQLPEHGMRGVDAMRLIGEELVLDGIPMRNLATFVTTWMEPEAQRVIADVAGGVDVRIGCDRRRRSGTCPGPAGWRRGRGRRRCTYGWSRPAGPAGS